MLSKKTIEILEQHDITLHKREKQDGQFYREIEFYSDAGEDVIETIWYDGTNESFCRAFNKNADDFDPDDHAEMYVNMRGQQGVPDSIRTLIEDADGIKETLTTVAKELLECL